MTIEHKVKDALDKWEWLTGVNNEEKSEYYFNTFPASWYDPDYDTLYHYALNNPEKFEKWYQFIKKEVYDCSTTDSIN